MQEQPHHMTENLLNHPRIQAVRKMLTSYKTSTFASCCSATSPPAYIFWLQQESLITTQTAGACSQYHATHDGFVFSYQSEHYGTLTARHQTENFQRQISPPECRLKYLAAGTVPQKVFTDLDVLKAYHVLVIVQRVERCKEKESSPRCPKKLWVGRKRQTHS